MRRASGPPGDSARRARRRARPTGRSRRTTFVRVTGEQAGVLIRPDDVVGRGDDRRDVGTRRAHSGGRGTVGSGARLPRDEAEGEPKSLDWLAMSREIPERDRCGGSYDSRRVAAATGSACRATVAVYATFRRNRASMLGPQAPSALESPCPHRRALGLVGALVLSLTLLGGMAPAAAAADGPTMDARVLLQGHARLGSWLAIEVRLQNEGAPVVGELRLQGGSQGGTRFSVPVDLPSPSDKRYTLYAQPPAFGGQIEVLLVVGDKTVASKKVAFTVHDVNQLTSALSRRNRPGSCPGSSSRRSRTTRTRSSSRSTSPTCRTGWRPGRRSIASSGRTSTPTRSRSSRSPRSAAGSRSAAG